MIEDKEFFKEQLAFCKEDLEEVLETKRAFAVYLILSMIALAVANMFFATASSLVILIAIFQTIALLITIRNLAYLVTSLYAERVVQSDIFYYESVLKSLEGDKEEE